MGISVSSLKKEDSSDSKVNFLFIENKHHKNITVLQIQHESNHKFIINIKINESAILKTYKDSVTFIYIYSGDEIKGDPITKIKNYHLFNKNTTIYIY